jgi:hypothetical protein
MVDSTSPLSILGGLLIALLLLAWLSRQISLQLQAATYRLTRSSGYVIVVLFLLLLPGIIVHEGAHWLVARLLGLKTGKFRVWPKPQGKHIGLGSVSVQRGKLWQDSLVGLAPLLVGSALITVISQNILAADRVTTTLVNGLLIDSLAAFGQALKAADGYLWAYLLFTIGNAMMPSASDREPLAPLLLYAGLTSVLYIVLGLPLTPFASALAWLTPALQALTSALIFTILLDLVALLLWFILNLLLGPPVIIRSK